MRLLRNLGLGLAGLLLFVELVWLQLPGDRLSRSLENRLNPNLGGMKLELGNLETEVFGGTWDSVRLTQGDQELLAMEEVSFSLAPWYVVRGGVNLAGNLWGGEFSAFVSLLGQPGLRVRGLGLSPARQRQLAQSRLVSGPAKLDLNADLTWAQGQPQGKLSLEGQDWTLEPTAQATGLFFDLPQLHLDQFQLLANMGDGALDLDLTTSGDLTLSLKGQLQASRLEQILQREGTLDLVFQASPNSNLKARLGDVTLLLQGMQGPDGKLSGRIKGNLSFPQVEKL